MRNPFNGIIGLCIGLVFGVRSAVASTQLQVQIPQSLAKPGGYDHRSAQFGVFPYGQTLQLPLYYVSSTFCKTKNYDVFENRYPRHKNNIQKENEPFILMVDRGGCTFVKKARNAQKSGASAVLVADKLCLCSHEDCQGHSKEANVCEDKEPRMKDDGSSSDITIPSLLIFKEDADPIKETLMKNQDVTISLSFAVSKEGSRVQYGLWTIPSSFRTNNLLSSFGPTARHLGEHASFTPHEHLSDGTEIGCRGADGRNQCFSLCTNEGRYCARDPDDVLDEGVSGADVVKESLRRICIWNNYSHVDNGQKWWIYVSEFISNCFFDSDGPSENFKSKTCVSQSLVRAEIDETLIDACIKDSGGLEGNVANSLLDAALADLRKASIVSTPVATVNDIPLRGAFSSVNLFQAICTSFSDGTQPRICGVCTHCSDQSLCISEGACTGSTVSVLSSGEDGSIGLFTFFTYLLLLVVGMGTSAYWNRRRERRHVQESLRAIMAEYILLRDR